MVGLEPVDSQQHSLDSKETKRSSFGLRLMSPNETTNEDGMSWIFDSPNQPQRYNNTDTAIATNEGFPRAPTSLSSNSTSPGHPQDYM